MNRDITQYLIQQPSPQKEILIQLRQFLTELLPEATEVMSYGVPAFKLPGRIIMYAAFKNHVGIYPGPETIKALVNDLKSYHTSKGTIQFELNKPLPYDLIKKIVEHQK